MPLRLIQIAIVYALMLFGVTGLASASELGPQLAAAEMVSGFRASASLNEEALGSVSGFGLGQQSAPKITKRQDLSVILFDELGQRKGGKISSGNGTASVITNRVSAGGQ